MLYAHSFRFNVYNENTYVVFDNSRQCLIIDPGCAHEQEVQGICSFVAHYGLTPIGIFITHAHIDHVQGINPLLDHYPTPVYMHEKEMQVLQKIKPVQNATIYHLKEGDALTMGAETFQLLHTPGHTRYSLSIFNAANEVLFSGDVLFRNRIGKTTLPGGNYNELMTTITDKLFTLPEHTTVYPGHGVSTTIGYEKMYNEFICWE